MELTPGSVVAGRYRVDRKIGAGGMGEVWAGEHVAVGVRVALKTLLPAAACDPQVVTRFRREAHLLGRLRSDRVARVVDFVEDARVGLVLVMDFVEGELLTKVIESRRLTVEETIDLGVDIVSAVCDLHRAKIVHRDLKPDNIILEPRGAGGRRRAVIVDFGVSRVQHSAASADESLTNLTMADMAVGTIPYMAPEQMLSSRDATAVADLYAVGAILFRAVAGAPVFGDLPDVDYVKQKLSEPAPPLQLGRVDRVALGLASVVARALERRPEGRQPSAEAMLRELTDLQDLARANAMDLDAPTEEAPPHLVLSSAIPMEDEMTTRMSGAPDTLVDELYVESTLESPGTAAASSSAATLRDAGPPPSRMPSDAPTRISVPPRSVAGHRPGLRADEPPSAPSPGQISSSPSGRPTQVSPDPYRDVAPPPAPTPAAAPAATNRVAGLSRTLEVVAPPLPAPRREARPAQGLAVPLWIAVVGMIAALVLGVALGFAAHARIAAPGHADPAGTR
jgi:serine/threonine-protein kinase